MISSHDGSYWSCSYPHDLYNLAIESVNGNLLFNCYIIIHLHVQSYTIDYILTEVCGLHDMESMLMWDVNFILLFGYSLV